MDTKQIISEIKTAGISKSDRMELLKSYPEPVLRYLNYHLPKGIPEKSYAEVRLKGIIKLVNWSNFKSTLYANPMQGFLWKAVVRMGILPVKGFDFFQGTKGAMSWHLFSIIPVMKADGPDISRSAEGRAKMEAIFSPHLLIHPKVKWEVISENEITATWKISTEDKPVHLKIGKDGSLQEVFLQRWGNPGGVKTFDYHTFGGKIENEAFHNGLVIPQKGHAGWWYGEKRYDDGEFFRFEAY